MHRVPPSPLVAFERHEIAASRPRFAIRSWLVAALIGVVVLFSVGIGGRDLAIRNTDIPAWPELAHDATMVHGPNGASSPWQALIGDHAPAVRLAKRVVVAINGEIDGRVTALAGLLCHATALGLLFWSLSRALKLSTVTLLAAVALGILLTGTTRALAPLTSFNAGTVLLVLSLVHLAFMGRHRPGSAWWWLGTCAGIANVAASTAGLSSALALVVWQTIGNGPRHHTKRDPLTLLANLALLGAGFLLGYLRMRTATAGSGTATTFASLFAWPFSTPGAALLVWAPAVLCTFAAVRHTGGNRATRVLPLLGIWSLAQLVLLAATGTSASDAAAVLVLGLVINLACFASPGLTLGSKQPYRETVRFVMLAVWAILVALALFRVTPPEPDLEADAKNAAVFRHALLANDTSVTGFAGTNADREAAAALIRNQTIRHLLPASIRAPLPLSPTDATLASDFASDAAPLLRERDALPAYGTWLAAGPTRIGEFTSAPLRTDFPFVQIRVAGALREPATSLRLRTESGRDILPLTRSISGTDRWRRVNFVAPHEPFRVVVRDTSATEWIAVTAPIEFGRLTWIGSKIPRYWTYAFAFGALIAAALAVVSLRRMARAGADAAKSAHRRSRIPWHVVPWIAVFAYAAFFANHIDANAGPNDSGGYLNSAKLMVNGELTAAPRTIFGADDDLDITAYLPITFHANGHRMVPEYPVGWPLEVALFGKIIGLARGIPTLILLQLLLGVLVTQRFARTFGLPTGWAWLAAGIVGLSPVYLFEGLQPVSDVPALLWVTTAVYWAWLGREHTRYAVLAGLATALAVMIRPSNLLCVLPAFLCLAGRWRAMIAWMLAGAPGAVLLAWYQRRLYGNWHTTGYGDVHTSFAFEFVRPTLQSYATWLPEMLTPLLVLGFAAPFLRTISLRVRLVLTSWVALFIVFYALYWCTWDNWYNMRFVLPAFPPMIVLALLVAHRIAARAGLALFSAGPPLRTFIPTALLVGATLGFLGVRTAQRNVVYWMHSNHKPTEVALWMRDHVPANAVVFAKHLTGSLYHYTDLTFVRLDYAPAHDSTALYERILRAGRPVYAATCHWETRGFEWGHGLGSGYPDLPGDWERVAVLAEGDMLVWKWRPPASPRRP